MKWHSLKIGEVCNVFSGATPKTGNPAFWDGDIFWATPKDLSDLNHKYLKDTARKITEEGLRSCSATLLPAHSVLFSSRAPIGLVAINTIPVCTNQGFKSMVPRNGSITSDYLYWWLKIHRSKIEQKGRGATFKEVSKAIVEEIEIPLPPIEEQKRIAAVLDAADALRAKRREAIAQLDALLQSTFLDMFGDPVTNPKGWDDTHKLGELTDIVSGVTKGRRINGQKTREIAYLAVVNVQDRYLSLKSVKTIEATLDEIAKYSLRFNDILLTEGGDPDKLGRGSLWHEELRECIHQNHIFRVRVSNPEKLHPVFLNWLIGSIRGKTYFLRSAKQTTGIASINMTQLRAFPVLIPPFDLQRRFASIVEAAERQKAKMRAHLDELDTLFASLQSRAFKGEL